MTVLLKQSGPSSETSLGCRTFDLTDPSKIVQSPGYFPLTTSTLGPPLSLMGFNS